MEARVTEDVLPGVGRRYEIEADGSRLYVIAHRDGRREFGFLSDGDEAVDPIVLGQQTSVTLGALLLGARFVDSGSPRGRWSSDQVVVEVVELAVGSPVIGLTQAEIHFDDPEALVLAVISDSTPDLVEDEIGHRCLPGDRVVVAARAARISHAVARLREPEA